jgi:hypothetical protein
LNETKATAGQDYIDKFTKELPLFFEYFPELKVKELIPVFASLYIPKDRLKYLSKNKIYVMAMKDDLMGIRIGRGRAFTCFQAVGRPFPPGHTWT